MRARVPPAAAIALLASSVTAAHASPAVIVFGGGPDPASTQVSIEAHVLALSRALARKEPQVFFSAGRPELRVVQTLDPTPDPLGDWLARILGPDGPVAAAYRAPKAKGAAMTRDALLGAVVRAARQKRGAVVFGAGHGDAARDDVQATLALWGGETLTPADVASALDARGVAGPVALVLGHCYSGAFTRASHVGADPTAAIALPARCVLAAVPDDRTASGCTADASDPDARAYLAVFAEALSGAQGADADGDRRVSLAEAHAWAVLHDATVDVPVKSSEAWLRTALGEEAAKLHELPAAKVHALARPEARRVLDGLRGPGADATAARAALDALDTRLDALEEQATPLLDARDDALEALRMELLTRWPELSSPYHRVARGLMAARGAELLSVIEGAPAARTVRELDARIDALDGARHVAEVEAARIERWQRTFEAVALEAALRKRGAPAQIAALDALLACEAMVP